MPGGSPAGAVTAPRRRAPPRRSARRARARSRRRAPPWARRARAASGCVAHEAAGERELLPLAERHLDAARPGRPELVSRARRAGAPPRRRPRPGRRRAATAGSSSTRGTSPTPTDWRAGSSKRKKSWNAPASRERHSSVRMRDERRAVHQDPARGRLVELAQQLDERRLARAVLPDERHHGARGQARATRRRARAGRCRDRRTTRPRGGCPRRSRAGAGWSAEATSEAA